MSIQWIIINNYDNYSVSTDGCIKNNITNRILKTYVRNGYKSISLCKNNSKKTFNIHTLVASHFLNKPDGQFVVHHKNENKLDNQLNNLEYTTYRENTMFSMSSKRTKNTASFELVEFCDIPNYTKYMISKKGEIYSKSLKHLCRTTILPNGYHKMKLKGDNGIYKDLYLHILVAMTFLDYIPSTNKIVINHIDGNKGKNTLENLEIITQKMNMEHSVKMNHTKIFRKPVYYINDTGKKIEFTSAKAASISTKIDNSSILKSCKSADKMAGNIKWYYLI